MYLKVVVKAGARKERIEENGEGLRISVREAASGNLANKRVRALVALYAGVPETHVHLVSGYHSPTKKFSVRTV